MLIKNSNEYTDFVRGLVKPGAEIQWSLTPQKAHLAHMALLITSEAGELADAIKKHTIYGKSLDLENVLEEAGDILFSLVGILDSLGFTLEDAKTHNVKKLSARYPSGGYSDKAAVERADKPLVVNNTADTPWKNTRLTCAPKKVILPYGAAGILGSGMAGDAVGNKFPQVPSGWGYKRQGQERECCGGTCVKQDEAAEDAATEMVKEILEELGFTVSVKK